MKKILVALLVAVLMVPVSCSQTKTLEKAQKNEYKVKMKEFKKENWKVFGTTRTLEVALLTHYDKMNTGGTDVTEIVGISTSKSKNILHQAALNSACNTYASQAGSHVKGRIVSDMATDGNDLSAEFDRFYAAYERLVEKEIKGEMTESFSIIRDKDIKEGIYEMQSFYIINESAATKARIRAFENATKESEAAQKYATKVSEFVQEGFKNEAK